VPGLAIAHSGIFSNDTQRSQGVSNSENRLLQTRRSTLRQNFSLVLPAASRLPIRRCRDSAKDLPHSLSGHDLRRRRPTSFERSPKILHEDTVCRGGLLLDLYSDGRQAFADLAHPRIRPQHGQPACYCLIKRFGSDLDRWCTPLRSSHDTRQILADTLPRISSSSFLRLLGYHQWHG
jgi:hypothetical protein